MGPGLFAALFLCAHAADAPEIVPVPDADGSVRTAVTLAVPIDRVRAELNDPIALARFSPDITSIKYLSRGECPTLRVETGKAIVPVTYDYKRCTTATGWRETLVSSEGLAIYEVDWQVEAVPEGTRLVYDVNIQPSFPAPQFLVLRSMKSSVTTIITRLAHALGLE